MPSAESFPRHSAQTQGFTLGAPRDFSISPHGDAVYFLRSPSGTNRSNALWKLSTHTGEEHLVVDPADLQGDEQLTAHEQARRERARERATGITGYTVEEFGRYALFGLSGRLFRCDLDTSSTHDLGVQGPVADPRPAPTGDRIAYLSDRSLRLVNPDGSDDHVLAASEDDTVSWGNAEFIAAEEMGRQHGYWWAPDGRRLLVARVDESPVHRWYLTDPTNPADQPRTIRYPAAGTGNAEVTLHVFGIDGSRLPVDWDHESLPYLTAVHWSKHGPPLLSVQSRDQRTQVVLKLEPETGRTTELHRETDPHWVELHPSTPAWTPSGELVTISVRDGAYRLLVDGKPWSDLHWQIRAVLDISDEDILVSAYGTDPTEIHLLRCTPNATSAVTTSPGVHNGVRAGSTLVLTSADLNKLATTVEVFDEGHSVARISSNTASPDLSLRVELLRLGQRELASALLLPNNYRPEQGPLPVLLDPYGGPQGQRVLARQRGFLTSQWFADQGFAVLVTDGRGMSGRGPDWDRAVAGNLAEPPLDDQIDALHAAADRRSELDLTRVAMRGWSFGGFLAAMAVLRRPDVFHAAIAGAPVCDQKLYDTHYTERYLGDPHDQPENYANSSPITFAADLTRPLLLIHGLVDDNVVPAHTLRLSEALTAAARPHTTLMLPGVSHVPRDETNLLLLQADFLHRTLAVTD